MRELVYLLLLFACSLASALLDMPTEMTGLILGHLGIISLLHFGATCKSLYGLAGQSLTAKFLHQDGNYRLEPLYLEYRESQAECFRRKIKMEIERINASAPLPSPSLVPIIIGALFDDKPVSSDLYWNNCLAEPLGLVFRYASFKGNIFVEPKPPYLLLQHNRLIDDTALLRYILNYPTHPLCEILLYKDRFQISKPHRMQVMLTEDLSIYEAVEEPLTALDLCLLLKLADTSTQPFVLDRLSRYGNSVVLKGIVRVFAAHWMDEKLLAGIFGLLRFEEAEIRSLVFTLARHQYYGLAYSTLRRGDTSDLGTERVMEAALMHHKDDVEILALPSPGTKYIFTVACLQGRSQAVLEHLYAMTGLSLMLTHIHTVLPGVRLAHHLPLAVPVEIFYRITGDCRAAGLPTTTIPNANSISDDFLARFLQYVTENGEPLADYVLPKCNWNLYDYPKTCLFLLKEIKAKHSFKVWMEIIVRRSPQNCQADLQALWSINTL